MQKTHKTFKEKPKKHRFILFTAGMSVRSARALENLRQICDKHLQGNYEMKVIDINKDRSAARKHQVIAIPTLIKVSPAPVRTIIGDLSDRDKVLTILDINE